MEEELPDRHRSNFTGKFIALTEHVYGAKVTLLLTTPDYLQRATDVQYVLRKVQEFYIEAALQIKARFPIGDALIEMFEVLDPNASHSKFPSLVPLAASFPNIISVCDLQKLDDEWRKLAIGTLPF